MGQLEWHYRIVLLKTLLGEVEVQMQVHRQTMGNNRQCLQKNMEWHSLEERLFWPSE